jgi:hypothetical protein
MREGFIDKRVLSRPSLSVALAALLFFSYAEYGTAQESRKKPAIRSVATRQTRPLDSELARLRADVIEKMKESRASAEKLLALHEEAKAKLTANYQQRREFYNQGLISRVELNQAERALANVIVQIDEDKRWIAESDSTLTEASTRDALLQLPALGVGGYSESAAFIRFNGVSAWSLAGAPKIESFFSRAFGHALPISAFGQTATHDRLRFDHHNAVDVALHPDSREGRALLSYLRQEGIPFIAFRHAVSGAATGAHIHIGNPSVRTMTTAASRADCCKP